MRKLLVLLACLSLSSSVFAADAETLFRSGASALEAGRAGVAIKDFSAAYAQEPSPRFLYWLGVAHRAAGHPERARRYYERYLKAAPKGDEAPSARWALAKLRKSGAPAGGPAQSLPLPEATGQACAAPPPAAKPPAPTSAHSKALSAADSSNPGAAAGDTADATGRWKAAAAAPPEHAPVLSQEQADFIREGGGDFWFVSYVARYVAVPGQYMNTYATLTGPGDRSTLYTHGFVAGRQTEHFRHGLYAGFGTEFGGGPDTLKRYELSYQLLYTPFGFDPVFRWGHPSTSVISPHIGLRAGAAGVDSQVLTGGSMRVGLALAVQAGLDIQPFRWLVVSPGVGYDTNVGVNLDRKDASVSGFSFDLAGTLRY